MPPEPTISKTRMKKRSTSRRDGRDRDVEDYRFDGGHSRELELKRSRGKSADIQLPLYCLTDPLLGLLGLLLNSLTHLIFWCGRSLFLTYACLPYIVAWTNAGVFLRNLGEVSCAECRRLKIKCDKQIPCTSCQRRGCAALCPNGSLSDGQGTRSVLAATEHLHRRIGRLSARIRQLEDALASLHAQHSDDPHPLLDPRANVSFDDDEKEDEKKGVGIGEGVDDMGSMGMSVDKEPSRDRTVDGRGADEDDRNRELMDVYYSQLAWLFRGVGRDQPEEMIRAIYGALGKGVGRAGERGRESDDDEKNPKRNERWRSRNWGGDTMEGGHRFEGPLENDYQGPHDLALLFMMFAASALLVEISPSAMERGPGVRPQWIGKKLVAVKHLKNKYEGGWKECQEVEEIKALRTISPHPNIISLYDCFVTPEINKIYLVFEPMEGDLDQLIRSRKGRPFAGGLVGSIFLQIASGLDHIHSSGYRHHAMEPKHILVTTTGILDYNSLSLAASSLDNLPQRDVVVVIKISHFTLAREAKNQSPFTASESFFMHTLPYRAPEILLQSKDYSEPADMWALGTIMAEVLNLRPIFASQNTDLDQLGKISEVLGDPSSEYGKNHSGSPMGGGPWSRGLALAQAMRFEFPKIPPRDIHTLFDRSVPTSLIHCIRDLLKYDPDSRLTSGECLNHQYFVESLPRNKIPSLPYSTGTESSDDTNRDSLPRSDHPTAQSSVAEVETSGSKSSKREADRIQREAEKTRRALAEKLQRQQTRAIIQKLSNLLLNSQRIRNSTAGTSGQDSNISDAPRRLMHTISFQIVLFPDGETTPEYAILSHRWSLGAEVSLDEYIATQNVRIANTASMLIKNGPGYAKIVNACQQARRDGIDWVWIDTCCIDRGSHDDVARNVKSMYGYYRNAKVCYAFLADVGTGISLDGNPLKDEVEESDWFRRGWTLQELLAPKEVVFFNRNWEEIGRRSILNDTISLKTGIPEWVLEGRVPVQDVDVVKRLCWSVDRQTTKPEDQAYCLLGILGVTIEPSYGEGVEKAFERLQKVLIRTYPHSRRALDGVGHIYSLLRSWSLTSRVMVDELDFDSSYSSASESDY